MELNVKKMSLLIKLLDLMLNFFLLTFFNDLIIKCVVGFGGTMKNSKDPWQLIIE
jgi:hypothetical protein